MLQVSQYHGTVCTQSISHLRLNPDRIEERENRPQNGKNIFKYILIFIAIQIYAERTDFPKDHLSCFLGGEIL